MTSEVRESHPNIEICPTCKEAYKNISLHWETSSFCSHPEYSPAQKATLAGMFLYKGYLNGKKGQENNSFSCFFDRQSAPTALFQLYGSVALKTMYIDEEDYFGQRIRRKYSFHLRAHPYLTAQNNWGIGRDKTIPYQSTVKLADIRTIKFLYEIIGDRGYDGTDMIKFDCTRSDAPAHLLRNLLNEYNYQAFVSRPHCAHVVVRETGELIDDMETATIRFQ